VARKPSAVHQWTICPRSGERRAEAGPDLPVSFPSVRRPPKRCLSYLHPQERGVSVKTKAQVLPVCGQPPKKHCS
jgi:hypothetical protein